MSDYADVESSIVAALYTATGVDTQTEVPNPIPPRFIHVDRTGGRRTNRVTERVQLTILTYAPTKAEASRLATTVRTEIDTIRSIGTKAIYRIDEVGGPVSSPDPDTNQPCYQQTVAIYLRT